MSDSYQAIYDAVRSRISGCDVGAAIQAACSGFDISHAVNMIQYEFVNAAMAHQAPSVLMRPKISKDGNQWCALYGDNLQDGVAGFGNTPSAAMRDFDNAWSKP